MTHLRVRKAAHISMAPQKETSPSPWLKCMSPILKLAPSMKTGKYTCHAAHHVCFASVATHALQRRCRSGQITSGAIDTQPSRLLIRQYNSGVAWCVLILLFLLSQHSKAQTDQGHLSSTAGMWSAVQAACTYQGTMMPSPAWKVVHRLAID